MTIAGIHFPCFDCKLFRKDCGQRYEVQRKIFFSIGKDESVECAEFEEKSWHGIEGVKG